MSAPPDLDAWLPDPAIRTRQAAGRGRPQALWDAAASVLANVARSGGSCSGGPGIPGTAAFASCVARDSVSGPPEARALDALVLWRTHLDDAVDYPALDIRRFATC